MMARGTVPLSAGKNTSVIGGKNGSHARAGYDKNLIVMLANPWYCTVRKVLSSFLAVAYISGDHAEIHPQGQILFD